MTIEKTSVKRKELEEKVSVLKSKKQAALHSPAHRKNARHYENQINILVTQLAELEEESEDNEEGGGRNFWQRIR